MRRVKTLREIQLTENTNLCLVQGSLTGQGVDGIVNAANSHLAHGGGLAAAIVRAGGAIIQQESDAWVRQHGPVSHAEPAYTGAGRLPCQYVIHAVGPVWQGGGQHEDADLAAAVTGSLRLAERLGLASIALPAISTGIFGYPRERAARVILASIAAYLEAHPTGMLQEVRLALLDDGSIEPFVEAFDDHFGTKS